MRNSLKICVSIFVLVFCCTFISNTAFAQNKDLSISEMTVRFSSNIFLEGNPARVYATIHNNSSNDLLGTVSFMDETSGRQIGTDQTISVFANKTDDVFIDYTPWSPGQHVIKVSIDPWNADGDDPSNNVVRKTIDVMQDTDHDGIPNEQDPDDDNDGVNDEEDPFPVDASEWLDTDGDRTGDNNDLDDDNDSYPDTDDAFPLDFNEWEDSDEDGIGNNEDKDDDNDELSDDEERTLGSDPNKPDTDEDGINDKDDAFPLNTEEWEDYDNDGIGDNSDEDDDDDGILDENDSDDHNKGPIIEIQKDMFAFLNRSYRLNANESYDEDGQITSYKWEIEGHTASENSTVEYTFKAEGKHKIKITIIDDKNESRDAEIEISVINFDFYLSIALISTIIFLAIIILIKYSSGAKNTFRK